MSLIVTFALYFYITRFAADFLQLALSAFLAAWNWSQLGLDLRLDARMFQELSVLTLCMALDAILCPPPPLYPFHFSSAANKTARPVGQGVFARGYRRAARAVQPPVDRVTTERRAGLRR